MKKIMIALTLVAVLIASNLFAQDDHIVIKNGTTLTVYTLTTYGSGSTEISTNTYTGTDVSILKSLEIPQDAWPLFANNTNLLFSTQAFVLAQQKTELEENHEVSTQDLDWTTNQLEIYKTLFWLVLSVATLIIVILSVSLSKAKKRS